MVGRMENRSLGQGLVSVPVVGLGRLRLEVAHEHRFGLAGGAGLPEPLVGDGGQ
jgi:hypothetical protein